MATRSYIGVQKPDGSIEAVYCHFDGYPQGVGHTLHTYHNSLLAAASILELGDLSYLAEKLAPEPGEVHKFGNAIEGVTVAYMRDRGETGLEARTFPNVKTFTQAAKDSWAEYVYLFRDGAWSYSSVPERGEPVWSPCFTVAEFLFA